MVTFIIVAIVAIIVFAKLVNSVKKTMQKVQGKNRCTACGSRLKAINGDYQSTCRKCGTRQPWAKI